eukprot:Clim_evm33s33 gene=Clim_evmTU33s33
MAEETVLSLPPQVDGPLRASMHVRIDRLTWWHSKNGDPPREIQGLQNFHLRVHWWGEKEAGAYLAPLEVSGSGPEGDGSPSSVVYAIRTSPKHVALYFEDVNNTMAVTLYGDGDTKLGECKVGPLTNLIENGGLHGEFGIQNFDDEEIARVEVSMAISSPTEHAGSALERSTVEADQTYAKEPNLDPNDIIDLLTDEGQKVITEAIESTQDYRADMDDAEDDFGEIEYTTFDSFLEEPKSPEKEATGSERAVLSMNIERVVPGKPTGNVNPLDRLISQKSHFVLDFEIMDQTGSRKHSCRGLLASRRSGIAFKKRWQTHVVGIDKATMTVTLSSLKNGQRIRKAVASGKINLGKSLEEGSERNLVINLNEAKANGKHSVGDLLLIVSRHTLGDDAEVPVQEVSRASVSRSTKPHVPILQLALRIPFGKNFRLPTADSGSGSIHCAYLLVRMMRPGEGEKSIIVMDGHEAKFDFSTMETLLCTQEELEKLRTATIVIEAWHISRNDQESLLGIARFSLDVVHDLLVETDTLDSLPMDEEPVTIFNQMKTLVDPITARGTGALCCEILLGTPKQMTQGLMRKSFGLPPDTDLRTTDSQKLPKNLVLSIETMQLSFQDERRSTDAVFILECRYQGQRFMSGRVSYARSMIFNEIVEFPSGQSASQQVVRFYLWRVFGREINPEIIGTGEMSVAELQPRETLRCETVQIFPVTDDLLSGKIRISREVRQKLNRIDGKSTPTGEGSFSSVADMEISVIRASGLQRAALELAKGMTSMQYPSHSGVNAFVRVTVPGADDVIQTPVIAGTFTPDFDYHRDTRIGLTVRLISNLQKKPIIVSVMHRPAPGSGSGAVVLGRAKLDAVKLLTRPNGLSGWHQIFLNGRCSGAIELDFKLRGVPSMPLDETKNLAISSDDRSVALNVKIEKMYLAKAIARPSVFIARFALFDHGAVLSPPIRTGYNVATVDFNFREKFAVFISSQFLSYLSQEMLRIDFLTTNSEMSADNFTKAQAETMELFGSAFVDLAGLLDSPADVRNVKASTATGGLLPLINEESPLPVDASVLVKVYLGKEEPQSLETTNADTKVPREEQELPIPETPASGHELDLDVTILSALHLPLIVDSDGVMDKPTTYVTVQWLQDQALKRSVVMPCASCPSWNHRQNFHIEREAGELFQAMNGIPVLVHVWNQAEGGEHNKIGVADRKLGTASVDLSSLLRGMNEISGWYHLFDSSGKISGQVKVRIGTVQELSWLTAKYGDSNAQAQLLNTEKDFEERDESEERTLPVTMLDEEIDYDWVYSTDVGSASESFLASHLRQNLQDLADINAKLSQRLKGDSTTTESVYKRGERGSPVSVDVEKLHLKGPDRKSYGAIADDGSQPHHGLSDIDTDIPYGTSFGGGAFGGYAGRSETVSPARDPVPEASITPSFFPPGILSQSAASEQPSAPSRNESILSNAPVPFDDAETQRIIQIYRGHSS